MNIRDCFRALLALVLIAAIPRHAVAAESYDNCAGFITSLPATIATQGTWCLNHPLGTAITSGNAITINTNNVTIDCNGFRLTGQSAGAATQTVGIFATGRSNLIVRHCDIRGFQFGLSFTGAGGGHVVEDNRFASNTNIGMYVNGSSVVRRNQVYNTGGSSIADSAFAIDVSQSVDVLDNTISGVIARGGSNGDAAGILSSTDVNSSISGNRVRGVQKNGTGVGYGIQNLGSTRVILRDNDLTGVVGAGGIGIYCSNGSGSARGNVTHSFATAISNCSDAGGNFHAP
jgi:hypothetical protein